MSINRCNPDIWKEDIVKSVDLYNSWFLEFAPKTFRESRLLCGSKVKNFLTATHNLFSISPDLLKEQPNLLSILRMSTCPPLARDRLVGLSGVPKNFVYRMENVGNHQFSSKKSKIDLDINLNKICEIIKKLLDYDIFIWLNKQRDPTKVEILRASTIVADRLCGAISDPIIRNAQEKRQLDSIAEWLQDRNYVYVNNVKFNIMKAGTFSFRVNIPIHIKVINNVKNINISVDVLLKPKKSSENDFPIFIEAKSAGDLTNVNKRRKEESDKIAHLRKNFGNKIKYVLFLCGYFDSSYLGYEAAEGIDWIWEHRIDDLALLGL
ncbi:MAG: XamI family restriction endonuclease [Deltaproteobacteria bacterium]|jgi:hypothetical protein|nr:XamI family restriction endonuclease [Deltaproteobacteria bacterium]